MLKSILKASLCACALLALSAHAAGLGKLTVFSGLGQPFKAEIDLVAVKKDEIGSLVARLASVDAFKQANVEYSPVLARIKFSVETRSDGQPYIKLTSTQPVNEPFVTLLVELNWSTGRLLREYSLLLDPPGFPTVKAPEVKPAPVVTAPAKPKPEAPVIMEKPKPAAPIVTEKPQKPRPSVARVERKRPAMEPVKEAPVVAGKDSYGPIKRGDTLWRIAMRAKPEGISIEQMLVALFRANRDAFIRDNMNLMRTGPSLRVPDKEQIAATAQTEAVKEFRIQTADWEAYRQKLAGAAVATAPSKAPERPAAGKITTKVEEKAAAPKEPAKDVLKLSKGEAPVPTAAAAGKDTRSLQDKVRSLEEEAAARSKALKEANERVGELEKNVKEMQRLLEIKNQQLAELQKQAGVKPAPAAPVAPAPKPEAAKEPAKPEAAKAEPAKPEPAKPEVAKTEPAKPEAAKAEPAKPEPAKPEPGKAEPAKPEVAPVPAAGEKPAPTPAEKPAVEAAKPEAPKPAPKPAAPPPPPPSLLDEILGEPIYLGVLGGVVLLIIGGVFVLMRKKPAEPAEPAALKTAPVLGAAAAAVAAEPAAAPAPGKPATTSTQPAVEVDPLEEAAVYIQYAHFPPAEAILKEAIAANPNRQELRLKLLEVYAAPKEAHKDKAALRQDQAAFESTVKGLQTAGVTSGPVWEKVMDLGHALDPQNPLYSAGRTAAEGGYAPETSQVLGAPAPDIVLDTAQTAESPKVDFDFDLGAPAAPEAGAEAKTDIPLGEAQAVEVAAFEISLPGVPPSAAAAEEKPAEPALSLDIALAFETTPVAAEAPAEKPEPAQALNLDNALMFEIPAPVAEAPPAKEKPATAPEISLAEISFDLGETPKPAGETASGEVKDAHWQEVATKFDLAKAYQEMGNKEGAREILQEVIREGDAKQQEDAKALLAGLLVK